MRGNQLVTRAGCLNPVEDLLDWDWCGCPQMGMDHHGPEAGLEINHSSQSASGHCGPAIDDLPHPNLVVRGVLLHSQERYLPSSDLKLLLGSCTGGPPHTMTRVTENSTGGHSGRREVRVVCPDLASPLRPLVLDDGNFSRPSTVGSGSERKASRGFPARQTGEDSRWRGGHGFLAGSGQPPKPRGIIYSPARFLPWAPRCPGLMSTVPFTCAAACSPSSRDNSSLIRPPSTVTFPLDSFISLLSL